MLGHRDLALEDYVGILKRRWWLILACTIGLLAVAVGISYVIPPQYLSRRWCSSSSRRCRRTT
jgi:uncharacterized protein involved in exopolysaccharide biosynthesis